VPGARRSGIVGRHGDGWKIRVSAVPEGGRANDAVLELIARKLDISRRDVELTSGMASRDKVVTFHGVSLETAETMLEAAAERPR
jgi:uncharacterized protein YggU (UPF0235/DUF167 family)